VEDSTTLLAIGRRGSGAHCAFESSDQSHTSLPRLSDTNHLFSAVPSRGDGAFLKKCGGPPSPTSQNIVVAQRADFTGPPAGLGGVACATLKCARRGKAAPRAKTDRRRTTVASGVSFMKSTVIKHSVVIAGHKTSVSLEDPFWKELKAIAAGRDMTVARLVGKIASAREHGNLSSAIRLFVLDSFLKQFPDIHARRDGTHKVDVDAVRHLLSNRRPSQ
jgi:predicted DNA-binding ribbon-helix-helix protein